MKDQSIIKADAQLPSLTRACEALAVAYQNRDAKTAKEIHDQGDVDVAKMPVTELRRLGKWRAPSKAITIRQAIDDFLNWAQS